MMWARRLVVGTGFAVAGLAMASGAAGAATCVQTQTMGEPAGCVTPPSVSGNSTTPSTGALPFTAASSTSPSGSSSSPRVARWLVRAVFPSPAPTSEELAVVGGGRRVGRRPPDPPPPQRRSEPALAHAATDSCGYWFLRDSLDGPPLFARPGRWCPDFRRPVLPSGLAFTGPG